MLDYVYGHDQIIAQFVAQLIPAVRDQGFSPASTAIGVIDEQGRLIAGMVYHNYDPKAELIEMSGASLPGKYWLTRETLRRIYRYPFEELGCQQVLMRVDADDLKLQGVLARLGYRFTTLARLNGRGKDAVICQLMVEDWLDNRVTRRLEDRSQLSEAA